MAAVRVESGSLAIVDGLGPFFRRPPPGRINWSKIPFAWLDAQGGPAVVLPELESDFALLLDRARQAGYDAVSLDDLAHATDHPAYREALRQRLAAWRQVYRRLFEIAAARGFAVFLTTDVMFFQAASERGSGRRLAAAVELLAELSAQALERYPQLAGVIARIGERDGVDVAGDFRSRLVLRRPRQARDALRRLLPVFEARDRRLILRTWTVGAYPLGDLQWNPRTLRRVVGGIDSPSLVLSMKPGDSDFFRHLPLSANWFATDHPKLIEIEARREYEGAGELPAFLGAELEELRHQLAAARGLIGVSVWAQTGGWSRFRRLTFLEPAGIWNEVNAWAAPRVLLRGGTAADAVRDFAAARLDADAAPSLLELLEISERVVRDLFYLEEIGHQDLYLRRVRVPPLLDVYWDRIIAGGAQRELLRRLVADPAAAARRAESAYEATARLLQLGDAARAPEGDLEHLRRAGEIVLAARRFNLGAPAGPALAELERLKRSYRRSYPRKGGRPGFAVRIGRPLPLGRRLLLRALLAIGLRRGPRYRLLDHLLVVRGLAVLHPAVRRLLAGVVPRYLRKRAMGVETVLR